MTVDEILAGYEAMIGRVPPKVAKRIELMAEADPAALSQLEEVRAAFLNPRHLDQKMVQLMVFAILLTQTSGAARNHARAALRAGASRQELVEAANVAFLFRGLAAANHAGEMLQEVFAEADNA